jgi:hypothetical protein
LPNSSTRRHWQVGHKNFLRASTVESAIGELKIAEKIMLKALPGRLALRRKL